MNRLRENAFERSQQSEESFLLCYCLPYFKRLQCFVEHWMMGSRPSCPILQGHYWLWIQASKLESLRLDICYNYPGVIFPEFQILTKLKHIKMTAQIKDQASLV